MKENAGKKENLGNILILLVRECEAGYGPDCGDLWGLSLLTDGRESHYRKFAEGLIAISKRTNDLLPPTRLESHAHNLRNISNYSKLRNRKTRFKNSPTDILSFS